MTQPILCGKCQSTNRPTAHYCAACGAALIKAVATLQPGQVMDGRYTIIRELGRGNMGAVYLAHETQRELAAQTQTNVYRTVVIKEMLNYYDLSDPDGETKARKRFQTEAATLYTLRAANIPQVFDYFSEGGSNYIVMQYIEGKNLESSLTRVDDHLTLLPGRRYTVDQVRRWGIQLCRVLESLAANGVVHMDIKPANLILDSSDNIWLVDFGTARVERTVQVGGQVGRQKSSVYGTAGYAPPEQYSGHAEPRSDVYALAATLYHLTTDDDPRKRPFQFPGLPSLPIDLRQPLEQALEMDVNQRLTAEKLRGALENSLPGNLAFRWYDGSISHSPETLLMLTDSHWEEACRYFQDGSWENWFKSSHRNDLVAHLQRAKQSYHDPCVALDAFIRGVVPSFPPAQLQASAVHLDFGIVAWDQMPSLDLDLYNTGSGCLHGKLLNVPSWLKVSMTQFATRTKTTVRITLDPASLGGYAQVHLATLVVDAGAGQQLPVAVQVSGPVFIWPGQPICHQPSELGLIAFDHWQEARAYFVQDGWSAWFKAIQRPDLVLAQEKLRKQAKDSDQNPDQALDAMIRLLNPALPPPVLDVTTHLLDFGSVPWRESRELTFEVINVGKGLLAGAIRGVPNWLNVTPMEFALSERQTFKVRLIADILAPDAKMQTGQFVIDAGTAGHQVLVVRVVTPEPSVVVVPAKLNLGTVDRADRALGKLTIRNDGESRTEAVVRAGHPWLTVHPETFSCSPGSQTEVRLTATAGQLGLGRHNTTVTVQASAGSWQMQTVVPVRLYRPILRHLWLAVGPALDWAALGGIIGMVWVFFLVSGISRWSSNLLNPLYFLVEDLLAGRIQVNGLVSGVESLLVVLPGLIVGGWVGVLGHRRMPARFGCVVFLLVGWALPWIYAVKEAVTGNLLLIATLVAGIMVGPVWGIFGVFVASSAAGALLWFLVHLFETVPYRESSGRFGLLYLATMAAAILVFIFYYS